MSEKKTFKNPPYITFSGGNRWVGHDNYVGDKCATNYSEDEWDMEVTFTKKVKPLAAGDVVKYGNWSDEKTATIIAIDSDQCWLRFSDGSHVTWKLDEVRR